MKVLIFIGTFAEGERLQKAYSFQKETSPVLSGIGYTTKLWTEMATKFDKSIAISNFPCSAYPYSNAKKICDDFWDGKRLSVSYDNKRFVRNISAKRHLLKSVKKNIFSLFSNEPSNEYMIFLCDPWGPLVDIAVLLKKKFKNSKLIVDLPDLPIFTNRLNKNLVFRFVKRIYAKRVMRRINCYSDSFVFFSKEMPSYFNLKSKNYFIHEGVVERQHNLQTTRIKNEKIKIVYTGSMDENASNLTLLIDAFKLLNKNSQYSLYLAGGGMNNSFSTKNINDLYYLGQLSFEETRKLQLSADILISLRLNTKEFNRAFPSKMFEYISCMKPIVCTKLDSYPDLISEYCYLVDTMDSRHVASLIESINFDVFYQKKVPLLYDKIMEYYSVESLVKRIIAL